MQEIPGEAEEGLQQFHRLKKEGVEALRYRGEDVLKSLTKRAVRQARARDLKLEVLNCSKLQVSLHFQSLHVLCTRVLYTPAPSIAFSPLQ